MSRPKKNQPLIPDADAQPEEGCKGNATTNRLSETMESGWASKQRGGESYYEDSSR